MKHNTFIHKQIRLFDEALDSPVLPFMQRIKIKYAFVKSLFRLRSRERKIRKEIEAQVIKSVGIVAWCKNCRQPRLIVNRFCPGCVEHGNLVFDSEINIAKEASL
jgi:hypothetical protein